jgi:hypothetical protein
MAVELTLSVGGFTPALRSRALEIMEKLMAKPSVIGISDQKSDSANSFEAIRDRLTRKKHSTLAEWREDVIQVIDTIRASGDEMVGIVCDELDRWFSKRYNGLLILSEFRFKDALTDVVAKMRLAHNEYAEHE